MAIFVASTAAMQSFGGNGTVNGGHDAAVHNAPFKSTARDTVRALLLIEKLI